MSALYDFVKELVKTEYPGEYISVYDLESTVE